MIRVILEKDDKSDLTDNIIMIKNGTFKEFPGNELVGNNGISHMFMVIDILGNKLRICPLSSRVLDHVQDYYPQNVQIKNYTHANLRKPSYVNTAWYGIIDNSDVYKVVGKVPRSDAAKIHKEFDISEDKLKLESFVCH